MTFAERLNKLFDTVHPRHRKPYSNNEIADMVNTSGAGETISSAYISLLRRGERTNPGIGHVQALAHVFGVRPRYFFDEDVSDIDQQLDTVAALRDTNIRRLATRASHLTPDQLTVLQALVDQLTTQAPPATDPHNADQTP